MFDGRNPVAPLSMSRKAVAPPSMRRGGTALGEPCKPLQAREGAAKPVSPMEFP